LSFTKERPLGEEIRIWEVVTFKKREELIIGRTGKVVHPNIFGMFIFHKEGET